jgi:hypothetical protein
MTRSELIGQRIAKLTGAFEHYVQEYDEQVPFTSEQLAAHRACIALRKQAGNVRAAVGDESFVRALHATLRAWGVGVRASRLLPKGDFAAALQAALPQLEELEPLTIGGELPFDFADRLWSLISTLGVVENAAKVVAGTKTLHHLLPDLVVPMDRAWTGTFFQFHLPEWQDPGSQRRILRIAYTQFAEVGRRAHPGQHVTGQGWRTSPSKIIDNALIGFCKAELGGNVVGTPVTGQLTDNVREISFDVSGYPPAKNEALSMLGPHHSHKDRVLLLLNAAQQAAAAQSFEPVKDGHIAMDVVLRSPAGKNPADATNYLGGIADVLEEKSQRGPLAHLDKLAEVHLYGNDSQIKQITYREIESAETGYTVTLRQLG